MCPWEAVRYGAGPSASRGGEGLILASTSARVLSGTRTIPRFRFFKFVKWLRSRGQVSWWELASLLRVHTPALRVGQLRLQWHAGRDPGADAISEFLGGLNLATTR